MTPTIGQAMSAAEINLVLVPPGDSAHSTPTALPAIQDAAAIPFGHLVPHSGMIAIATSQQSGFPASNAIDSNVCTSWVSLRQPYPPLLQLLPADQSITLNLGKIYNTTGLAYLPQQDIAWSQEIMKYEVAVSLDDKTFSDVAQGTWDPTQVEKYAHWSPTAARFVRLTAITSSGGDGVDAAAANLEVGYR